MAAIPSLPKNPQVGDPRLVSDLNANDAALLAAVNSVDTDQLAAGLQIPDSKIASPNNGTYKIIKSIFGQGGAANAGKFGFSDLMGNGKQFLNVGGALGTSYALDLIRIVGSDYVVAGKSTKLRLQVLNQNNGVVPLCTYTFALFPVTAVSFTAASPTYTVGAAVTDSTVVFTPPAANAITSGASTAFAIPADGNYVLGYTCSATAPTVGEGVVATVELAVTNV